MTEPFIGEVRIMSFSYAPRGWAQCNGQSLQINQNQALFSLLGTTFGGNGQTTFNLPDLRGRAQTHTGSGFSLGQSAGNPTVTLTIPELPQHNHPAQASGDNATGAIPTGNVLGANVAGLYGGATNLVALNSTTITAQGGSQPHENMQPYTVLNFCIALVGIFPSRN